MKKYGVCNLTVVVEEILKLNANVQYVVLGPCKSPMPLVRVFSESDKIFRQKKNTLNNERYRDLLISILSYDEVSAFLLRVKTRN